MGTTWHRQNGLRNFERRPDDARGHTQQRLGRAPRGGVRAARAADPSPRFGHPRFGHVAPPKRCQVAPKIWPCGTTAKHTFAMKQSKSEKTSVSLGRQVAPSWGAMWHPWAVPVASGVAALGRGPGAALGAGCRRIRECHGTAPRRRLRTSRGAVPLVPRAPLCFFLF